MANEGDVLGSRKAVVVGAGPVGCLTALSFAKMGWHVDLFETRPDTRLPSSQAREGRRSVNLAISSRGITALEVIDPGVTSRLLEDAIPMRGRMIHGLDGTEESQLYDTHGQFLNSLHRGRLNQGLLEEVSKLPGVELHFQHKVLAIDFESRMLTAQDSNGRESKIEFHLCVGADGSYSVVRRQMMRVMRMDFQQEYIPHDYVELHMSPGRAADGTPVFRIDPSHLHIWPRHSFMLIALPNKDKSFTCTLYAPTVDLDTLDTREAAASWFISHFPDVIELIGRESLLDDFLNNPRSSLISIKANPYHYQDCALIIGDAAHAMVPFYGQGLNCGLEDVRVLTTLLRSFGVTAVPPSKHGPDDRLSCALSAYSKTRHEDLVAIRDLAMDNYVEMRHSVTTPVYHALRMVDSFFSSFSPFVSGTSVTPVLSQLPFPTGAARGWLPLYTMVTFRPDISYGTAKRKAEWQRDLLGNCARLILAASVGVLGAWKLRLIDRVLRR